MYFPVYDGRGDTDRRKFADELLQFPTEAGRWAMAAGRAGTCGMTVPSGGITAPGAIIPGAPAKPTGNTIGGGGGADGTSEPKPRAKVFLPSLTTTPEDDIVTTRIPFGSTSPACAVTSPL